MSEFGEHPQHLPLTPPRSPKERKWAEQRIRMDRENHASVQATSHVRSKSTHSMENESDMHRSLTFQANDQTNDEDVDGEAHHRLLNNRNPLRRRPSAVSALSVTADSGLTRQDVLSAFLNYKIWHLLVKLS